MKTLVRPLFAVLLAACGNNIKLIDTFAPPPEQQKPGEDPALLLKTLATKG